MLRDTLFVPEKISSTIIDGVAGIYEFSGDKVTRLGTYLGDRSSSRLRAEQDKLPIYYRQHGQIEWYGLKLGEEISLGPYDEYGVGLVGEYEPLIRRWVVPQKSH